MNEFPYGGLPQGRRSKQSVPLVGSLSWENLQLTRMLSAFSEMLHILIHIHEPGYVSTYLHAKFFPWFTQVNAITDVVNGTSTGLWELKQHLVQNSPYKFAP